MAANVGIKRFMCITCGAVERRWYGACPSCKAWGTMKEKEPGVSFAEMVRAPIAAPPAPPAPTAANADQQPRAPAEPERKAAPPATASVPVPITDVPEDTFVRDATGIEPLDLVLGGGLVIGSVVLIAALPGAGKTTLTLQMLRGMNGRALYVSCEETVAQVAGNARRIGAACRNLHIVAEHDLDAVLEHARNIHAHIIAIDSIQKIVSSTIDARAGTAAQVRECTQRLVRFAKASGTTLWLIGQVTSDGSAAGPKQLEHEVDVVIELEHGVGDLRILRCPTKNRYGKTDVPGRFTMTDTGLQPYAPDEDGGDGNDDGGGENVH